MKDAEVVGHGLVVCASCKHLNEARSEWCDRCLTEFGPAVRRRPRRLSTRAYGRASQQPADASV